MTTSNPLEPFKWKNRILLVFADSQNKITEQMQLWKDHQKGLDDRDLVIFQFHNNLGKAPNNIVLKAKQVNWFYDEFVEKPVNFKVILIGKDGSIKLEQSNYLSKEKLFSTIDAMPMRQREMANDGK